MASIYKRGNTYWGRMRCQGQELRQSLGTSVASVARQRLRKWQDSVDSQKFGDCSALTFSEAAAQFVGEHFQELKPQSARRYAVSLEHLARSFGSVPITEIKSASLSEFASMRRHEGASPPTVRRDLACLSSVYGFMIEKEMIEQNPVPAFLKAKRRRGLKESPPRTRYLSHDEEAALKDAAGDYLKPMIQVAIDTGLRLEEQLSLTWSQVRFDDGVISLSGEMTKSGVGRIVPMLSRVRTILGTLKSGQKQSAWVHQKADGSRYHKLTRGLAGSCQRAGIDDLRWHDLRRTAGCRLIQDHGLSMEEVKDWLGHQSIAQTERAYAFLDMMKLAERVQRREMRTKTGTRHAD